MEINFDKIKLNLKKKNLNIPELRVIDCEWILDSKSDCDINPFSFFIDERDNTINFNQPISEYPIELQNSLTQIIQNFSIFKSKDFRYGTIGKDVDITIEPTIHITGENFFNFLITENRESLINNIFKNV